MLAHRSTDAKRIESLPASDERRAPHETTRDDARHSHEARMKNTDCRKCGAPMPEPKCKDRYAGSFTVTSFRCPQCGHVNNLKRRKEK